MERLDQPLPAARRPPVALREEENASTASRAERRGATLADRLLIASALLLVVSAAGLASGTPFEGGFLVLFGTGMALTLIARRMLAVDARAEKPDPR